MLLSHSIDHRRVLCVVRKTALIRPLMQRTSTCTAAAAEMHVDERGQRCYCDGDALQQSKASRAITTAGTVLALAVPRLAVYVASNTMMDEYTSDVTMMLQL